MGAYWDFEGVNLIDAGYQNQILKDAKAIIAAKKKTQEGNKTVPRDISWDQAASIINSIIDQSPGVEIKFINN